VWCEQLSEPRAPGATGSQPEILPALCNFAGAKAVTRSVSDYVTVKAIHRSSLWQVRARIARREEDSSPQAALALSRPQQEPRFYASRWSRGDAFTSNVHENVRDSRAPTNSMGVRRLLTPLSLTIPHQPNARSRRLAITTPATTLRRPARPTALFTLVLACISEKRR
jgi:hypothetical protein